MKPIPSTRATAGLLLLTGLLSLAAAKEVQTTRGQAWGRLQLNAKLHPSGLGVLVMAGSRYNFSIDKQVDGGAVATDPQQAWLQELWIGPTYGRKLSPNASFSANLLYRPQWWYLDGQAGQSYMRQTIANTYSLSYRIAPKATLFSRLMLWDLLGVETGDGRQLANEFLIRPLLGIRVPLSKRVELMLDEELFLKPTANRNDLEGQQTLYRNALWAGANIKVTDDFKLTLNYVNYWTNLANTAQLKQRVVDHYVFVNAAWALDFAKAGEKKS